MDKKEMIYGTRAVMEAIRAGRQIERVFVQSGLKNELTQELLALARKSHVPLAVIPQEKINRMSTKNHQGVICVLSAVQYANLDHVVQGVFEQGRDPFVIVLDRITDMRNFGAIVRTAEGAGVDVIVVPEKGNAPVTADAMKTSAGALNFVPVARVRNLKETVRDLRQRGLQVIAVTEKAQETLFEVDFRMPTVLLLGSEEDGISPELLREADRLALIPMKGKIESLNVSVSAGIAMYEFVRQKAGR
ncbi:MAG: 23S rRNA (guanosine(2251)-2'-O)-methyltransferase RlmB [Cyclobacteriaceae bacterium]|nr:23S rRNA (guanosine(2251)-2'-O)-methyltransferase RlmB [Cyclobacteriaceae bacterium]